MARRLLTFLLRDDSSQELAHPPQDSLSLLSLIPMSNLQQVSLSLNARVHERRLDVLDQAHPKARALYEALRQKGVLTHFCLYRYRIVVFFDKDISAHDHTQGLIEILEKVYDAPAFMVG